MSELTAQQKFSQSLRNLADWYEQHPDVPLPSESLKMSAWFVPDILPLLPTGEDEFRADIGNEGIYYRVIKGDGFEVRFFTSLKKVADFCITGQATVDVKEWAIKTELLPQPLPAPVSAGISDNDIPW